jgi:hypothetical protein
MATAMRTPHPTAVLTFLWSICWFQTLVVQSLVTHCIDYTSTVHKCRLIIFVFISDHEIVCGIQAHDTCHLLASAIEIFSICTWWVGTACILWLHDSAVWCKTIIGIKFVLCLQ